MNDKMRKNILELSRTMNPSVIARMSGVSLAEVTDVLGSDNSGAPRNGAMSTMKFTSGMNMVPEGYPRDEIKDPLRIQRDTTSQGTMEQMYKDIGTPYEMPTTPSGGAAMNPMDFPIAPTGPWLSDEGIDPRAGMMSSREDMARQQMMQEDEMLRRPMNPQQFTQEDMMRQERGLMNPNVPRQGFDPYMDWRNRR